MAEVHATLALTTDAALLALEAHATAVLSLAATTDDAALSLLARFPYAVVLHQLTTDDALLDMQVSIAPLAASLAWLAAAAHAATIAQETGAYAPILRVRFPSLMRTFTTAAGLGEPLLARLSEGGVGSITRSLDELTLAARLGGSSAGLPNMDGFLDTFMQAPFLNTDVIIDLGFVGLPELDYLVLFTGVLDRYQFNRARLEFAFLDASVRDNVNLNVPIDVNLFPNAPSASRGQHVPIFLGVHTNAPVIQVSGTAATGTLEATMDTASLTVILLEDSAAFPLAGLVTVGSEALSYGLRRLINLGGRTYVELSDLTRTAPAAHALGTVVTLTDLEPSYLTGFGVDTLNAIRVNGVALDPGDYSVSVFPILGHMIPLIQLLFLPDANDVVTVDVNAASPLLDLSPAVPPPPPPTSLLVNGAFGAGDTTGWTLADATAEVSNGATYLPVTSPNLLVNGGFETGTAASWSAFTGTVTAGSSAPTPQAGGFRGEIAGESGPFLLAEVHQSIGALHSTPFGAFYPVTFRAWYQNDPAATVPNGSLLITLRRTFPGTPYSTVDLPLETTWTEVAPSAFTPSGNPLDVMLQVRTTTAVVPAFVDSLSVTQAGLIASQAPGTPYRLALHATGGTGTTGACWQDVPTVLGTEYEYRVTWQNASSPFVGHGGQAALAVGTPVAPDLYVVQTLTAFYPAAPLSPHWSLVTGRLVATTTTTRLTLRTQPFGEGTVLPAYFASLTFTEVPALPPMPGGTGSPILSQEDGENPADVIRYLLALFYPTATVNAQAFATARVRLDGMRFRGLLTNPGDSGTLLQRLGRQAKSLVLRSPLGEVGMFVLDDTRPIAFAFDEANLVTDGESPPVSSLGRGSVPTDAIYTSITVYYDTLVGGSTSPGDYAGVVYATPTETTAPDGAPLVAACASAYALYGRDHRLDIYADAIRDIDSAHQLLAWLVSRHAVRQDVLTWRAWVDAVPLQLGQVVSVAHPLLANDGAVVSAEVVEWAYQPGASQVTLAARTLGPSIDVGLVIAAPPVAHDDVAQTVYTRAALLLVLSNDEVDPVTMLDPGSIDLDPATPGRQTSYTDPGRGTFVVNMAGEVTFTPVLTVTGDATAAYTVADYQGTVSNAASLTVTVTGPVRLLLTTDDATLALALHGEMGSTLALTTDDVTLALTLETVSALTLALPTDEATLALTLLPETMSTLSLALVADEATLALTLIPQGGVVLVTDDAVLALDLHLEDESLPTGDWVFLELFLEPIEAVTATGLHIINAFAAFDSQATPVVAVTGDPRFVGGLGEVEPPGYNDVYSSSRVLARPYGTEDDVGFTVMHVVAVVLDTSGGDYVTAMVNALVFADELYVAFNVTLASDEEVNGPPVIFSANTLVDMELEAFKDTWIEEQEFPAGTIRVGAMIEYGGALYVALEPETPATDALLIWRKSGGTWAEQGDLGTGLTQLRSFCLFLGALYAGADGVLYVSTGGAWTVADTFTGVIDALAVRDGVLYINVRNGSTRELWTTPTGEDATLLHTLTGETAPLPGVMVTGLDTHLYVSMLETDSARIYVYNGDTWTLSSDWGDAFPVGITALALVPDNRLYVGLSRRWHARADTTNAPDAEVWYLPQEPPLSYAAGEWLLFLEPTDTHVTDSLTTAVAVPYGGSFVLATLAIDGTVFGTPGGDTTLSVSSAGVLTVDYAGGVSGTNISLGYRVTDTNGRHWEGPLLIRWDTVPVPRPNSLWTLYTAATAPTIVATIGGSLTSPTGFAFDETTLEIFGTLPGMTFDVDGAGTLTVTRTGSGEQYGGVTYQVRDTEGTLMNGALYVGFLA
jgi:hypothetical protein